MKYSHISIIPVIVILLGGTLMAQTHPSLCKNICHKKTDGSIYLSTDYGETWYSRENKNFISLIQISDRSLTVPNLSLLPPNSPSSLIWQNSYTSGDFSNPMIVPQAINESDDGKFAVCGDVGYVKYFLKIDVSGNEIKRTHYGSTDTAIDIALAEKKPNNNGFYFVGKKRNFFAIPSGFFCQVITDNEINIQASNFTDSINSYFPNGYSSLIKSHDGGYFSTAMNSIWTRKYDSLFVSKIDNSGIIQWTLPYSIEANIDASAISLIETHDANLVFGVKRTHAIDSSKRISDCLLFKTDSAGNILWSKSIQSGSSLFVNSLIETNDGNILLTGEAFDGVAKENVFTALISSSGDILWEKTFGMDSHTYIHPICVTSYNDGNFILGGAAGDYHSTVINNNRLNWDMYLAKIDPQGKPVWQYTWGVDSLKDEILNVFISHDNKIVVLGETGAPLFPDFGGSMYMAKLEDGQAAVHSNDIVNVAALDLYPNPCTNVLNIAYSSGSDKVLKADIVGLMGNTIASVSLSNSTGDLKYNVGNLPSGNYFMRLHTPTNTITKPFTIVR